MRELRVFCAHEPNDSILLRPARGMDASDGILVGGHSVYLTPIKARRMAEWLTKAADAMERGEYYPPYPEHA